MTSNSIDRSNTSDTDGDEEVRELFHRRCVICGRYSETIHEIVTRGAGGEEAMSIDNRVVLCNTCHEWAHRVGTLISASTLQVARDEALRRYANREDTSPDFINLPKYTLS